jgi:hypothetical protein
MASQLSIFTGLPHCRHVQAIIWEKPVNVFTALQNGHIYLPIEACEVRPKGKFLNKRTKRGIPAISSLSAAPALL